MIHSNPFSGTERLFFNPHPRIFFFQRFYLFIFRQGEGGRNTEKSMRGCRSRMPPTGDLAHNPSLCPDLGIKPGTLWFEAWRWMHCATPTMAPYVFIHFKGRERRRNEKDQSEIGCNPGMCPGRELNPLNFCCVRWDSNQVSHWARAKILRDWVWLYPLPRQSIFFYSYSYGGSYLGGLPGSFWPRRPSEAPERGYSAQNNRISRC